MYAAEATSGFAHEPITVGSTAGGVGFTAATMNPSDGAGAVRALLTFETGECRFTYDGTAPTTTVGHLASIGERVVLEGAANLANFRAIRTGGTSGTLMVTYER